MSTPQPRPHQLTALADLTTAFAIHDRVQLVMACGTGKTLVGRWHAQAADAERVLVLLPSLALVAQTLHEWRRAVGNVAIGWQFSALVLCSDPTTAAGSAERLEGEDGLEISERTWHDAAARVTTDPTVARRFLRDHRPGRPQVVFSTYHSSPVLASALNGIGEEFDAFDLVICDEAHRLAGQPSPAFATVLDARRIPARKRLFMTATPKPGEDAGMDDHRVFGPVAHTVSFGDAIDAGLLTDYQVVVVADSSLPEDGADASPLAPAALVKAIEAYGVRRILSFHGRVAKAQAFAAALDGHHDHTARPIRARHVSGAMPTDERVRTLAWLREDGPDVRLVSNARCLSEGVDVPAVDGILFADKRSSVIDVIQAIGRVLRPAPGKTIGTIVLPVQLGDTGDDDSGLALSSHSVIWTVLRALRAHDQRFAADVDKAIADHARKGSNHRGGFRLPRLHFVFPDDVRDPGLELRVIQNVASMWARNLGLLQAWAAAHDGKLLPRGAKSLDGTISLGEWAEQQRLLRKRGLLDPDRAAQLEGVPGWSWDKSETRWLNTLAKLQSYAAEHGTVAESLTGESRFQGMYDEDRPSRHLGVWMATQRQAYRLGILPEDRATALEALPGWAWDAGLPEVDVAMVDALAQFVEFEKHANVPDDHLEDGLRLGAWCWAVRRRRLTGHLAPALHDEIIAATPSRFRPDVRWQWEQVETQWRLGYFALRQYTEREGSATPVGSHVEKLPDVEHGLGQWGALQRLKHRRSELDATKVALLEALPGWRWEVELQTKAADEPVELRPGQEHGTPGAYGRPNNCRCEPCLEWRRQKDRERLALQRRPADPVSAVRVRRHLEQIESAVIERNGEKDTSRNGRPLISALTGVPLGALRRVMRGEDVMEREHADRILAVTAEQILDLFDTEGSRGREITTVNSRIDPGPTFELLDDLAGRGFSHQWVARELGYSTSGLQVRRDRRITTRVAEAIERIHGEIGDLVMPPLGPTARKPRLAELKADAAAATREAS